MKYSNLLFVAAVSMLAAPGAALLSGCAVDPQESDPAADPASAEGTDESTGEAESAVADCSGAHCGNCVKHARCLKPSLPTGLFTCDDKKAIINSHTPAVGSVAIMNVGPWCHVGYVYRIDGSGPDAILWLDEANYTAGKCTTSRHGTASALRVLGYFE